MQKKGGDQQTSHSGYSSIDIYCWCFKSDEFESMSKCETILATRSYEIIKPENLLRSITAKDTIEAIESLVFSKSRKIEETPGQHDSRFLLLCKSNSTSDTIIFFNKSGFYYNSTKFFGYPFEVIDSLKTIINQKNINCTDNEPF
jgi:hypothetical protein